MAVKIKYEAKDGKQFDDRREADEWDRSNFEIWLESGSVVDANHFVNSMSEARDTWASSSCKSIAKQLLRQYWDEHVE